jgi:hypothetical protein
MSAQPSKHAGAGRKGKAAEHLIAASCILVTAGELNASTSLVDDEGVDIVFHKRGSSRTLAVQVKSRFSDEAGSTHLREKGQLITDVRLETFQPRDALAMLFAAVDASDADFGPVWFVPSHDFSHHGLRTAGGKLRFSASAKADSKDKWRKYRLEKHELAPAILHRLAEI